VGADVTADPPDTNGKGRGEPTPNRSTFLASRDVLALGRRYAGRARPLLIEPMREADPDPRTAIFLDTLERQRTELEQAIERCAQEAPESVLETRAQYVLDPWDSDPGPPPKGGSLEEVIEWILKLDEQVVKTFRDLSERASRSDVRQLFGQLADLVEGHDQKLARQSLDVRDI
jgi:hypothetical protein